MDRLVRQFHGLDQRLRAVEVQPQLAHSSLEDGAVNVYVNNSLRQVLGSLPDGSVGSLIVNGTAPPALSAPLCAATPGGFTIRWDGRNFDGDDVQPLDWARAEVHATTGPTFDASTLLTTFETPQGGAVTYSPPLRVAYRVALIARNQSGTASAVSQVVEIVPGAASLRPVQARVATAESTTSTAFTDLTTAGPSIAFTAPASGMVRVDLGCWVDGADGAAIMGFQVQAQDGTMVRAASDEAAATAGGLGELPVSCTAFDLVDGLTPAGSYVLRARYRTVAFPDAEASFRYRNLLLTPLL